MSCFLSIALLTIVLSVIASVYFGFDIRQSNKDIAEMDAETKMLRGKVANHE